MTSGTYEIKNIVTGDRYVGSSKSLKSRFITHKNLLKNKKHPNQYLQNVYNKYGESAFTYNVLNYVVDYRYAEQKLLDEGDYTYNILKNIADYPNKKDRKEKKKQLLIAVNNDHKVICNFKCFKSAASYFGMSYITVEKSYNKKQFTSHGIGFMSKKDYLNKIILTKAARAEKQIYYIYTIHNVFIKRIYTLKKLANYFGCETGNISRKINKIPKVIKIENNMLCKYLIFTEKQDLQPHIIPICKNGNYTCHDCFNNFVGFVKIPDLVKYLKIPKQRFYAADKYKKRVRGYEIKKRQY